MRHPHARNSLSGSCDTSANMPIAAQVPDGIADLNHAAEQARALLRRVLDDHQDSAAPLAAEADALQRSSSTTSNTGAATPIWL